MWDTEDENDGTAVDADVPVGTTDADVEATFSGMATATEENAETLESSKYLCLVTF